MANTFKVLDEGYIKYSLTTWQGEIEINEEGILYRYSEDDNGATLYIWSEDEGWFEPDLTDGPENYKILYGLIMMYGGTPEDLGAPSDVLADIDMDELEDYL